MNEQVVIFRFNGAIFELIQAKAGVDPIEEPGRRHQLDRAYFDKISAIEFAVKYDDGKNPQGFLDSDILLLGVRGPQRRQSVCI